MCTEPTANTEPTSKTASRPSEIEPQTSAVLRRFPRRRLDREVVGLGLVSVMSIDYLQNCRDGDSNFSRG